jgi:pimeloyl-ACP methyl ester carboxylesterase
MSFFGRQAPPLLAVVLRLACAGLFAWLPTGTALALLAPDAPLPWSQRASRADCPDEAGYLWLPLKSGDACLRYFASTDLQGADTAIVYLTGDRDKLLLTRPDQIPANTAQAQTAAMQRLSRQAAVPVVMLARPGTYGSSGDHRLRRRMTEEFEPLYAGLDLLRRRHGIRRLVLWGHSGGATAAAAMLTMGRTDLQCAVMTSAAFDYLERWRINRIRGGPAPSAERGQVLARAMYDPIAHVGGVMPDPLRAVYVLGDPRDTVTPFVLQTEFANALQRAGHRAVVRQVNGRPPEYHDMSENSGFRQATACARGDEGK